MASERLVEFLYILVRDYLPTGDIENIMWDQVTGGEPDSYCNPFIEGYVRDLAHRLTDDTVPITNWKHMYKPASRGVVPPPRYVEPEIQDIARKPPITLNDFYARGEFVT